MAERRMTKKERRQKKVKKLGKAVLRFLFGVLPIVAAIVLVVICVVQTGRLHSAKKELQKDTLIIKNYEKEYLNGGEGLTYQTLQDRLKVLEEQNGSFQEESEVLQEQIAQLEQQLADAEAEKSSIQEELNLKQGEIEQKEVKAITDATYLEVKFPSDGNYYVDVSETTFYADSTCTQKLSGRIRFMSRNVDWSYAENGLSIGCLRMDSGEICYCTQSPNLVTEKDWRQYYN